MVKLILMGVGIFFLIGLIGALGKEAIGFLLVVLIVAAVGFLFSPPAAVLALALIILFAGG